MFQKLKFRGSFSELENDPRRLNSWIGFQLSLRKKEIAQELSNSFQVVQLDLEGRTG